MSCTKAMLEDYYERRRIENLRRSGDLESLQKVEYTQKVKAANEVKGQMNMGLLNNSNTYCYWTVRGLQTLKDEYINNPFVDLDIAKYGALRIIDSAKRVDSWYRFEAEIKAAKSKQEILELFERANYNGKHYIN